MSSLCEKSIKCTIFAEQNHICYPACLTSHRGVYVRERGVCEVIRVNIHLIIVTAIYFYWCSYWECIFLSSISQHLWMGPAERAQSAYHALSLSQSNLSTILSSSLNGISHSTFHVSYMSKSFLSSLPTHTCTHYTNSDTLEVCSNSETSLWINRESVPCEGTWLWLHDWPYENDDKINGKWWNIYFPQFVHSQE